MNTIVKPQTPQNRLFAREVILNIETTGLDVTDGNRIIEIAAVELLDRRLSGNQFHRYLNPERTIEPRAQAIHGISLDFLRDKPKFSDAAPEFIEFVRDTVLVAHNARFDVGFINNELSLLKLGRIEGLCSRIVDSLSIAMEQRPGKRNNLNALCAAYQIDVPKDGLHGALLDAHMLAKVYLAMTRGLLH